MFLFFMHKKNYEIVKATHQQRILKKNGTEILCLEMISPIDWVFDHFHSLLII